MDNVTMSMLEYDQMKERLREYAVSYVGRKHIDELIPASNLRAIRMSLDETAEAKALLDKGASVPLPSLEGIDHIASLLHTGYLFAEQDFMAVLIFLNSCGQLRKYMASKRDIAPVISSYASSMQETDRLKSEIERCIRFGRVDDQASKNLERVRKKIAVTKERIQKKMSSIMSKHSSILQENLVSVRGGRYVIPVKREYHKQVKGAVLDQSTSGQTVYVEPEEISQLQTELGMLEGDEAREEGIILSALTGLLEASANDVQLNIEITGTYDFIFSKAKYSRSIDGRSVELNDRGRIQLRGARHPLMLKTMVPLQLDMGTGYRSLIITGPNTGGKTVALKTLGLLTLMVQSGVLVPVDEGSMFCMFTKVLTAIGDGQSIEQSLSTFSAQIRRLIGMVDAADHSTLLLIDELAAGTDPGEGMSLSIAILEELNRKGAMMLVTTHFNELKSFAARTDGFQNARMEFDVETLEPLYRLTIGEAGQSYAIEIAKKLGMLPRIVSRSQEILLDHKPLMRSAEEAGNQGTIDGNCGVERRNAERVQQTTNSKPLGLASELDPSSKYPQEIPAMIFKNRPKDSETSITVRKFEIGDAVYVSSYGRNGIVFELEDSMGMVGVMIQKQKIRVNKKRLQLFIVKDELYPEDYDFDIIFETKEDRKKSKMMNRKHVEGLSIIHKPSEE